MYAIVYHRVRDMTNADSRVCRKRVDVSLSRSIDSFASRDRGVAIVARLSFINEGPRRAGRQFRVHLKQVYALLQPQTQRQAARGCVESEKESRSADDVTRGQEQ